MKEENNKAKAIDMAVTQIERLFGKGSIMKLGEKPIEEVPVVSTGSIALDMALGIGGLPRGRVVEIYGPEASGKTTLALQVVAEIQKQGGTAVFIDAEHALDISYAKRIGVNTDDLLISQPDTGEQALEIAEHLVRSGAVDIVVVDSVAALVPRAEIEGEMGDAPHGITGAAHVPGPEETYCHHQQIHDDGHLHQPDQAEDRRHVRKPRDHNRGQRPEVLRVGAARHQEDRCHQGWTGCCG